MSTHDPSSAVDVASRVSERVARLYLDTFGKGPLHVETFVSENVLTTLLRDVFTVAEKAMLDGGRTDSVIATRIAWQNATDEAFRGAVAEITGRRVHAAISGFDGANDMASEVFVLAPRVRGGDSAGAGRSALIDRS